jgi:hypothetical protein
MNHYTMQQLGQEHVADAMDEARRDRLGHQATRPRPLPLTANARHLLGALAAAPRMAASLIATLALRIGLAVRG